MSKKGKPISIEAKSKKEGEGGIGIKADVNFF